MRTFYVNDIRRRVKVLTFLLAGWGALVALRLVQIQVLGHGRAKAAVRRQTQAVVTVEPRRGRILDRNGEILACSLPAPSIAVRHLDNETPAQERDKVLTLKRALGLVSAIELDLDGNKVRGQALAVACRLVGLGFLVPGGR